MYHAADWVERFLAVRYQVPDLTFDADVAFRHQDIGTPAPHVQLKLVDLFVAFSAPRHQQNSARSVLDHVFGNGPPKATRPAHDDVSPIRPENRFRHFV